jgi:type I restriction enzyme R subunit
VDEYNLEKDRVTIEQTFEALLRFVHELDEEEARAIREGLDVESVAIFDLLKKPELSPKEIARIKQVAVQLLNALKAEQLRVNQWRDKEATRDAVRSSIFDFLYSDKTGPPTPTRTRRSRRNPKTCSATSSTRTRRFPRRFMARLRGSL